MVTCPDSEGGVKAVTTVYPPTATLGEAHCQKNSSASEYGGLQTATGISAGVWKAMDSTLLNESWLLTET